MNKRYKIAAAALAMLALACNKDDSKEPNLPAGNVMTATIGGSYWNATDIYRISMGGDTMKFAGSRNTSKPVTIQLIVNKYHGVGSYRMNDTVARAIYTDNGADYGSVDGTLNVSADDPTHVAATFQFTGLETTTGTYKTIASGQLNINK